MHHVHTIPGYGPSQNPWLTLTLLQPMFFILNVKFSSKRIPFNGIFLFAAFLFCTVLIFYDLLRTQKSFWVLGFRSKIPDS